MSKKTIQQIMFEGYMAGYMHKTAAWMPDWDDDTAPNDVYDKAYKQYRNDIAAYKLRAGDNAEKLRAVIEYLASQNMLEKVPGFPRKVSNMTDANTAYDAYDWLRSQGVPEESAIKLAMGAGWTGDPKKMLEKATLEKSAAPNLNALDRKTTSVDRLHENAKSFPSTTKRMGKGKPIGGTVTDFSPSYTVNEDAIKKEMDKKYNEEKMKEWMANKEKEWGTAFDSNWIKTNKLAEGDKSYLQDLGYQETRKEHLNYYKKQWAELWNKYKTNYANTIRKNPAYRKEVKGYGANNGNVGKPYNVVGFQRNPGGQWAGR